MVSPGWALRHADRSPVAAAGAVVGLLEPDEARLLAAGPRGRPDRRAERAACVGLRLGPRGHRDRLLRLPVTPSGSLSVNRIRSWWPARDSGCCRRSRRERCSSDALARRYTCSPPMRSSGSAFARPRCRPCGTARRRWRCGCVALDGPFKARGSAAWGARHGSGRLGWRSWPTSGSRKIITKQQCACRKFSIISAVYRQARRRNDLLRIRSET